MITDDQVATLLREAVLTSPLPVDFDEVERRGHRNRATARVLGGLGAAAAVVVLTLSWGSTTLRTTSSSTGGNLDGAAGLQTVLIALAALALAFVGCGITSALVRDQPVASPVRRTLAAAWGVLSVLANAPLQYVLFAFVVETSMLGRPFAVRSWSVVAIALAFLALVWVGLTTRRRMLGRRTGGTAATAWLVTAWLVSGFAIEITFTHLVSNTARTAPDGWQGVLAPVAVAVLAVIAGVRLLPGPHLPSRIGSAVAVTVLLVASVSAVVLGASLASSTGASSWAVVTLVLLTAASLVVALLGARAAALGTGAHAWTTSVLLVLTSCLVTGAAERFSDLLLIGLAHAAPLRPSPTGYAVWTVVLSLAATMSLIVLDRRLDLGRSATSDVAEPRPEG